ncbi:MAG: class I SAM-dependent methyltransferase, partial [Verrucomicrobiota bacterium]
MDSRSSKTLRIRLNRASEGHIRKGHPWVYDQSIREQNREGLCGEYAVIYDRNNRFLAIGLYDPSSPIRIRILHSGKPQQLDEAWWNQRLSETVQRRTQVYDEATNGIRWIYGENDGWPGLVLDEYAKHLVIKIYSAAWLVHIDALVQQFVQHFKPKCIILRTSRLLQDDADIKHFPKDGQILYGTLTENPVTFLESSIRFKADLIQGQKTGFFLDQRENRRHVEQLSKGKSVLNLFSFSGGFSLYAARGGAKSVTSVDISSLQFCLDSGLQPSMVLELQKIKTNHVASIFNEKL